MIRGSRAGRGQRHGLIAGAAVLALAALVGGIVVRDGGAGPAHQDVAAGVPEEPTATTASPLASPVTTGSAQTNRPGSDNRSTTSALPAGLRIQAGKALRPADPVTVVTGEPLGDDRVHEILDRLPPLAGGADLATGFRWPTQSLTAPRAGTVVDLPFPAGTTGPDEPAGSTGALHVLRMQPQGTLAVAPFLSITFDQPMVPVATVGQLAARKAPATITPQIDGSWSWIGTETLRFAAEGTDVDRLPMATSYTVTVPAGTTSLAGGKLAAAVSFRFQTPPPTIKQLTPTGKSLPRSPVFVAVFDQNVDPTAILDKLTLTADGRNQPLRLATAAETSAAPGAAEVIGTTPKHRIVAFRPVADLPTDAAVEITLSAGAPSAEGPGTTTKAATFRARTYAAVTLTRTDCQDYSGCQAGGPIVLTFNNELDTKAFDPKTVTITPAIPGGATVTATGKLIMVQGATQASVRYSVTVAPGLRDGYGQRLAEPGIGTVTFRAAEPRLDPFPQVVTTVDPMVDALTVPVNTVNRKEFRERVFRVNLDDWSRYHTFLTSSANSGTGLAAVPDWPVLLDRTVRIDGSKNSLVTTRLDLTPALTGPDATRNVVVLIDSTATETFGNDNWQNRPTMTWVQATTLGVDALNDNDRLRVWVTDLRTGAPLPDTAVAMIGGQRQGRREVGRHHRCRRRRGHGPDRRWHRHPGQSRGPDGAARRIHGRRAVAALPRSGPGAVVRQRRPADLPTRRDRLGQGVGATSVGRGVRSALRAAGRERGDLRSQRQLWRAPGIRQGVAEPARRVRPEGRHPRRCQSGHCILNFSVSGIDGGQSGYSHTFEIADFRTPDFAVDTHGESALPYVVGDDLTVAADASYYAGGPWATPRSGGSCDRGGYVRPARLGYYSFGVWTPWWQSDAARGGLGYGSATGQAYSDYGTTCCGEPTDSDADVQTFSGTTDGNGGDYVRVQVGDLGKDYAGLPVSVTAQATVTDVNRQDIADTTTLLVHPADDYVGLAGDQTFVKQGADMVIRAVATDIDGKATSGLPITMRAAVVTTSYANGKSVDTEGTAETCRVTSTTEPVSCTFHPSVAGTYRITATVADSRGRTSRSQLTRWVSGPDGATSAAVAQQELTLVPDKETYHVGDSARVLVQSPITAGTGLATVLHNGIVRTLTFPVADGSAVLTLPVTEAEVPGVTVSIEVVGTTPRDGASAGDPPRPAYATGDVPLQVSTDTRTLTVKAVPRNTTVAPGGSTKLDISITDAQGKPVPAGEFEVVVADEAVLALGAQPLPDPLGRVLPTIGELPHRPCTDAPPSCSVTPPAGRAGRGHVRRSQRRREQRRRRRRPGAFRPVQLCRLRHGFGGRPRVVRRLRRADRAHRLHPAGGVSSERPDRRIGPGHGGCSVAGQPDPLPGDGGRGRRHRRVRVGGVDHHRRTPADRAAVRAGIPELR